MTTRKRRNQPAADEDTSARDALERADVDVSARTHVASETNQDLADIDWEPDRLIELVSDRLVRDLESPYWTDAQFVAWDAEDPAGQAIAEEERWSSAQVDALAARIHARTLAQRWQIPTFSESPIDESPIVTSPAAECVEEAARHACASQYDLAVAAGSGRELWDEPCQRWVRLPRGTRPGAHVALSVTGESMLPLLTPGDLILVRLTRTVRPGTIVVARHPDDGYVVKAVSRITRDQIELESLNPAFAPVSVPRRGGRVLGTVVGRWAARRSGEAEV